MKLKVFLQITKEQIAIALAIANTNGLYQYLVLDIDVVDMLIQ